MQHFAERIVSALAEAQCQFVIVGGLNAVLHGAPIVTQDLDVCYRRTPENLTRLSKALTPFALRLRNLPEGVPDTFDRRSLDFGTNFTLALEDGEEFDLLDEMAAIGGYDEIIGRTVGSGRSTCRRPVSGGLDPHQTCGQPPQRSGSPAHPGSDTSDAPGDQRTIVASVSSPEDRRTGRDKTALLFEVARSHPALRIGGDLRCGARSQWGPCGGAERRADGCGS